MSDVLLDASGSEEELEDKILSQALPVANLGKNVDLNVPPASGEEYLYRVRLEASKNKVVVAENINLRKFERNRTVQYFQSEKKLEGREEFNPTLEWQHQVSAELSELRERVRKEKKNFLAYYKSDKKVEFPALKSKSEWATFCLGNIDSNDNEALGEEPRLSLLYKMDQNTIVTLLEYTVVWVEKYGFVHRLFEWMYALFCFLEKPLLPETHSSLRTLARSCAELRSKLADVNHESLIPLNLFIALIGRYFEQRDLADN